MGSVHKCLRLFFSFHLVISNQTYLAIEDSNAFQTGFSSLALTFWLFMKGPLKVFTDSSNKDPFKRGSGSSDLTLWLFMRGVLDFLTRSSNKNRFKKGF